MKKVLFLLMFPVFVYGQNLQFTKWESNFYSSINIPFGPYFYFFKNDTLFESTDGGSTFTKLISSYQDSLNNISFIDINPTSCGIIDIGSYTYQISNDTLTFNLLEDSCQERVMRMSWTYWIRTNTSIPNKSKKLNLKSYPNPTKENITISIENFNGNIQTEVYDIIGNRLQTTNETTISLRDYSKGIYILKVAYGDKVKEVKVIKD